MKMNSKTTSRRLTVLLAVLMCAGTLGLTAQTNQTATITYLEGVCEYRQGTVWTALDFGSQVPANATIRVGTGGIIALQMGQQSFTISASGTFLVQDVLNNSLRVSGSAANRQLGERVAKLGTQELSRATTSTGGVRGDAKNGKSAPVMWAEDEGPSQALRETESFLQTGDLAKAMTKIKAAVQSAMLSEKDGVRLDASNLLNRYGYFAPALSLLREAKIDTANSRYLEYSLLSARVQYETMDFASVLATCNLILPRLNDKNDVQSINLLKGMSLVFLGKKLDAKPVFESVITVSPDTMLAEEARKMLNENI